MRIAQSELPPAVRRVLDDVKRRIRAYVWVEGLALLIVLVGAAFWLGLAVDWSFEPSPEVRKFGLFALAAAALYVAYRYLLRRVAVRISDSTAASLLERRFPALNEHVQTAVDIMASTERAESCHPDFVDETKQAAAHAVAGVHPGALFHRGPLVRAIGIAAALTLSVALFAVVSHDAFAFWLQRIALSDEPWPRSVHLEVVGFAVDENGFRSHKLAQDDDFELLVHASTDGYEVPDEVEIRFRLADGRRGRDTMIRVGEAEGSRDDFQMFRYQFKRVASDMEFDVVGGDDRVRDLQLEVVDRPELFALELECIYPDYLQRPPRRLPVTGGMRIPEGTRLVLHAGATKALTAARIHRAKGQQDDKLEFAEDPRKELRWEYGTLAEDDVLLVSVTDQDGVATREPYRISLAVVRDDVPQVAVRLAGIGAAITPDAILPLVGKVTDDYGLDRAWFEYQVDGGPSRTKPLATQPAGQASLKVGAASRAAGGDASPSRLGGPADDGQFDLRATDETTGKRLLELKPGQRFTLALKASDRFDLPEEPRVDAVAGLSEAGASQAGLAEAGYSESSRAGSSQQFTLDVVTPGDLLALLERRELALRQRYEAIYEKMTDTRNLLARVEFDGEPSTSADDASAAEQPALNGVGEGENGRGGDENGARDGVSPSPSLPVSPSASSPPRLTIQRALARRRLRVSGSLQNVVQSADEIAGIAEGFDDLGEQLANNRVDNPDLRSRLREQIAQPLHRIADERMPKLAAQLKLVEQHVEEPAAGAAELAKSLALADEILVEMRQVLDRMLELETYNEVVALLRDIISDQHDVSRRTKDQQKERLRSLFEEE